MASLSLRLIRRNGAFADLPVTSSTSLRTVGRDGRTKDVHLLSKKTVRFIRRDGTFLDLSLGDATTLHWKFYLDVYCPACGNPEKYCPICDAYIPCPWCGYSSGVCTG